MEEFNGEMLDSGLEVERMGVMLNIKKNERNRLKEGRMEELLNHNSFCCCFNVRKLNMLKIIEKDPVKRERGA